MISIAGIIGIGVGSALGMATIPEITAVLWKGLSSVGITIIVLIPLLVWAIWAAVQRNNDKYTYLYIASQAQTWGFLGTLIGVAIMMATLSSCVQAGDDGAIRKAIGGFSQAAISSLIGLMIASFCKHFHYLMLNKMAKEEIANGENNE
jgi:multisubunit Na+/H+ antiporter MnhG subunit